VAKNKLEATIAANIGFLIADLEFIWFSLPTKMSRESLSAVDGLLGFRPPFNRISSRLHTGTCDRQHCRWLQEKGREVPWRSLGS
jgi:hypothetical protein